MCVCVRVWCMCVRKERKVAWGSRLICISFMKAHSKIEMTECITFCAHVHVDAF